MKCELDPDTRTAIEDRQHETFRRLHRLVRKGYTPDFDVRPVQEAIFLDHLAGGPPLILYSDGKVVAINGRADINPSDSSSKDRIYNEDKADDAAFNRFLATLREPTKWEQTRPLREKHLWIPAMQMAIYLCSVFVAIILAAIYNLFLE